MKFILALLVLVFLLSFPTKLSANGANQFITIVNPVRISSYTVNPVASLNAEYDEIRKRKLSATWLLTYQAIDREDMVLAAKNFDGNQELGIFMEVSPKFAEKAKVVYNKTDSWHRANSLFLSGYSQEDRKKLIDTVFSRFREAFGYYPASVGSWWNDSFSLEYMREKYGVTANLACADQFETDGYHIWGQYWSVPFYPSKYHAGIPAKDADSGLDLVTIQWAPRDPLNGYRSSLYSSQDYFTLGFDIDYFEKIIKLYSSSHRNKFGQVTVGLEGDYDAETYKGIYAQQMEIITNLRNSGDYQIVTMKDFSGWYRSQFKNRTPEFFIEANDLLGKDQKAIWYQSSNYRIGMVYNGEESKLTIIDLRTYPGNFMEPFYLSPNFQIDLFINTPSVIDSISNPHSKWEIDGLKLKSIGEENKAYVINFENGKLLRLIKDSIVFEGFNANFKPTVEIENSPKLNFKKNQWSLMIYPKADFSFGSEGFLFSDLSINATYFFWRPKVRLLSTALSGLIVLMTLAVYFFVKKKPIFKLKLLGAIYIPFLATLFIIRLTNNQTYFVNQSEIDALESLAVLPYGKVVVWDGGCLICKWQTRYPPPSFAGKKEYVSRLSKKPVVYNAEVFQAKSRAEGRQKLKKLNAKYVYLVKYEGYIEEMPFSPGDLNVEKIYENANSEIWRVKK